MALGALIGAFIRLVRMSVNAMWSLDTLLVEHNIDGILIWSFNFVTMGQDVAPVSEFMSVIKSFLKKMKVGRINWLETEFGTFIREESRLLTATCITNVREEPSSFLTVTGIKGDIEFGEERLIRSKLRRFLIEMEKRHYYQLEDWKGDIDQLRKSFQATLGSVINLKKTQSLQRKKIKKFMVYKNTLQKEVKKYWAKLEDLEAKYDSGKLSYDEYTKKKSKTELKYDKVQRMCIYMTLFLLRAFALLEAEPMKPKELRDFDKILNRFLEVMKEIEELRKKELKGNITLQDLERGRSLRRELMSLMDKAG
ncbi:MAG: hypothetical protein QXO71_02895 [Candidatus Jordarchaeaceae archaeon]